MFNKYLYAFLLLFCSVTYGQIGGQSVYQFLNLVTSPRQAALGGKTVTIYDEDVNQANFNPATINPDMEIILEKLLMGPLPMLILLIVMYKHFKQVLIISITGNFKVQMKPEIILRNLQEVKLPFLQDIPL